MATSCYKYVVALRMLLLDMDIKGEPMGPTPMFTDSQILFDGSNCEKLAKASRWLSTRYAMIRHGTACGVVLPTKVPAADNIADIMTKALVGASFDHHRAIILGHAHWMSKE